MKRIAVPVIFGVITSAVHTLVLIPVYYTLYKRWEQWRDSWRGGNGELSPAPGGAEMTKLRSIFGCGSGISATLRSQASRRCRKPCLDKQKRVLIG